MLDWRLWNLVCEEYSPGLNVVGVEDLLPQGVEKWACCLLGRLCMACNSENGLCLLLCTFQKCIQLYVNEDLLREVEE